MKISSYTFSFIVRSTFIILISSASCHCSPPSSTTTTPPTSPQQSKGIWHTGDNSKKTLKINGNYPSNTNMDHLYQRPYKIYWVMHGGSCGFRSFIPILLQDILVDNRWKSWLQDLYNRIYKPAQEKTSQGYLLNNPYISVIPADTAQKAEKLFKDTEDLLQKLSLEATPRKLEETEITLLVDFLRQCVVMNLILTKSNPDDFNTALQQRIKGQNRFRSIWMMDVDFQFLAIPYGIMYKESPSADQYKIGYYHPKYTYIDGSSKIGDPRSKLKSKDELPKQVPIMIYYNGKDEFDYIVDAENE